MSEDETQEIKLPLTDSEIDAVTDFIKKLHSWISGRAQEPASEIEPLTKEYERILPLLVKGDINIVGVLENADRENSLIKFYDCSYAIQMERQDWITVPEYNEPQIPPETFKLVLEKFSKENRNRNVFNLEDENISWMDIRNEVKEYMLTAINLNNEIDAEKNDPLISKYETIYAKLNFVLLKCGDHIPDKAIILDSEYKLAQRRLAIATLFENVQTSLEGNELETEKHFFLAWFNARYKKYASNLPVGEDFIITANEALNNLNEILTKKGIGPVLHTQIDREYRDILIEYGANVASAQVEGRSSR